MAWHLVGTYLAPCSCDIACPCLFGAMDGDRGWCSGMLAFDVTQGDVDGVDVSGAKAALLADWPRGFLAGNGTGRLYFDTGLTKAQKEALGPVLSGQRGGVFEAVGALMSTMLDSTDASITIEQSDSGIRIAIGDAASTVVEPLRDQEGRQTKVLHGAAAFREETNLGRSTSTKFSPADLRAWDTTGGHAEWAEVDWSG